MLPRNQNQPIELYCLHLHESIIITAVTSIIKFSAASGARSFMHAVTHFGINLAHFAHGSLGHFSSSFDNFTSALDHLFWCLGNALADSFASSSKMFGCMLDGIDGLFRRVFDLLDELLLSLLGTEYALLYSQNLLAKVIVEDIKLTHLKGRYTHRIALRGWLWIDPGILGFWRPIIEPCGVLKGRMRNGDRINGTLVERRRKNGTIVWRDGGKVRNIDIVFFDLLGSFLLFANGIEIQLSVATLFRRQRFGLISVAPP